jgi:hypothetical protein
LLMRGTARQDTLILAEARASMLQAAAAAPKTHEVHKLLRLFERY